MPNTVRIISSNDVLQVDAGGVVNLDGGSLRANDIAVIPPAPNVPDGRVLTSQASAAGGVSWQPVPTAKVPTPALSNVVITNPQDGDVLVYDAKAGVWRNKRLGLSEGT